MIFKKNISNIEKNGIPIDDKYLNFLKIINSKYKLNFKYLELI